MRIPVCPNWRYSIDAHLLDPFSCTPDLMKNATRVLGQIPYDELQADLLVEFDRLRNVSRRDGYLIQPHESASPTHTYIAGGGPLTVFSNLADIGYLERWRVSRSPTREDFFT